MARGRPKPLMVNSPIYRDYQLYTEYDSEVQLIAAGDSKETLLIGENKCFNVYPKFYGNLSQIDIRDRTITIVTRSGNSKLYKTIQRTRENATFYPNKY